MPVKIYMIFSTDTPTFFHLYKYQLPPSSRSRPIHSSTTFSISAIFSDAGSQIFLFDVLAVPYDQIFKGILILAMSSALPRTFSQGS